ncbi:MAG TPA: chromate resistance protein ChrB domain-containing protein [Burkholderiales bacterium]|nr:chromate resistance protein ChrB domain-containing protein [Burkholderiales bacterium]
MDASISATELRKSLLSSAPPLVIDVRRNERFFEAKDLIRGALRRDPATVADWSKTLPRTANIVVYCVHGHEVSQNAAKALGAKYLEGGIEAWREMGGDLSSKPKNCPSRWVTRERPKIDRIACPWLIRRFIDPGAEFLYVPAAEVMRVAEKESATPYDVAEVEFTHVGERCSFDAFLDKFHLQEPALDALATIVRGADTGRLDLAPQAAGLLAISQGLSRLYENDLEMLGHGMVMYDALYAWCRSRP